MLLTWKYNLIKQFSHSTTVSYEKPYHISLLLLWAASSQCSVLLTIILDYNRFNSYSSQRNTRTVQKETIAQRNVTTGHRNDQISTKCGIRNLIFSVWCFSTPAAHPYWDTTLINELSLRDTHFCTSNNNNQWLDL